MSQHKIVIYSAPECPYCTLAKDFLNENNIEFEEIDVSSDSKKADEMMEKSGQQGIPVIEIDGKIIVGFDKEKIKERLNL